MSLRDIWPPPCHYEMSKVLSFEVKLLTADDKSFRIHITVSTTSTFLLLKLLYLLLSHFPPQSQFPSVHAGLHGGGVRHWLSGSMGAHFPPARRHFLWRKGAVWTAAMLLLRKVSPPPCVVMTCLYICAHRTALKNVEAHILYNLGFQCVLKK